MESKYKSNHKKNWKIHSYVEIKQHTSKQLMDQRRKIKKNQNILATIKQHLKKNQCQSFSLSII